VNIVRIRKVCFKEEEEPPPNIRNYNILKLFWLCRLAVEKEESEREKREK